MDSSYYYDSCYSDYANYYSDDHLHYGFWHDNTEDFNESLLNTLREVIARLDIHEGDRILDAGCGIGGSCRYIAEQFGVEIYGITNSNELLKHAHDKLTSPIHKKLINIAIGDYEQTKFESGFFNKLYALESFCHAKDKTKFTREAHRVLGNAGKIVVADFFKTERPFNDRETHIYNEWLNGWFLPHLLTPKEFSDILASSGFNARGYEDMTDLIFKSSDIIYDNARTLIIDHIMKKGTASLESPKMKNILSCCLQKECVERDIWRYMIFTASKP